METERKSWERDARPMEELPNVVLRDPLEKAQIRIAMSVGKILKPIADQFAVAASLSPNTETCNADGLIDCLWKLPVWERRNWSGKCGEENGCLPKKLDFGMPTKDENGMYKMPPLPEEFQRMRNNDRELGRAFRDLSRQIAGDFE